MKIKILSKQKGTIRQGLLMVIVILIFIILFNLIGYWDVKAPRKPKYKSSDFFNEDKEKGFFDDREFISQRKIRDSYRIDFKKIKEEELDPNLDPQYQETSTKNAFYHPLSPEKKREKEKRLKERTATNF